MADAEDVRRAFQEALTSDAFRTKLVAVWNRHDNISEARHFVNVYRSQRGQTPEAFPCCEIDLTISRNTDNRNDLIHLQHEVHLFVHDRHDNEEELEDWISRYLRAIREYFMDDWQLPGIGNPPMIFGDDQFSPFVPEDIYEGRPLLKSGLIVILMETLDNGTA